MDSSDDLENGSMSPAMAGIKRKASFSSSERVPKRATTTSVLDHLPAADPQPIPLCSVCHHPCWYCQAASASSQEDPEPSENSMARRKSSATTQSEVSRASSSSKRKREDGRIFVGPKDGGFQENILQPCNIEKIYIVPEEDFTPVAVFGEPSEIASMGAFLNFDKAELRRIAQQFMEYERRGDNEHTLSVTYTKKLLVDEDVPSPQGPVQTLSLRKDRWRPHRAGPTIQSNLYFFDWDVEPDVTYAVSINQFDAVLRKRLQSYPFSNWLAEDEGSSPYLTIEYKCGEKGGKKSHAINQNVCASVIWLYQRRAMRQDLELGIADLRHYSIVLLDGAFEIWEGRCDEVGFSVQILAMGNLKTVRDLKEYVTWSNAIHTWGLGPNAESFKKDVLELLKRSEVCSPLTPKSLAPLPETAAVSSSQANEEPTQASLTSSAADPQGDPVTNDAPNPSGWSPPH
ncbi:hypothetical protein GJ744_005041 [Endocarpon pusillum]|uniref:Uncharacterized protein n=1 Tax=Endocarpon pusillum TaxID=364733 RepID=A0A8H7A8A4_9EURO|nr:hypothetical protein GJ744_005041 [Endocarpon pusillum]